MEGLLGRSIWILEIRLGSSVWNVGLEGRWAWKVHLVGRLGKSIWKLGLASSCFGSELEVPWLAMCG